MASPFPTTCLQNSTPSKNLEALPNAYRLLYRGALSLPDSHILLDGLTFTARRDSPTKNNQLLDNPLALALETMRGRPSLRFMGVVKLHDGNLWWDESGGIEMDIHPRATLTRIYFENIFCLTPYASTSTSAASGISEVGVKIALGDSGVLFPNLIASYDRWLTPLDNADGPETTQVIVFARPLEHDGGKTLTLVVARLTARPPPPQAPKLRLPRPDDPTPRKPPVFYNGDIGTKRDLKRTGSVGLFPGARELKRTGSISTIPLKKKKLSNGTAMASGVADLGSSVRLGEITKGKDAVLFKVPDVPLSGKSIKGKGKEKESQVEPDVFGSDAATRPPGSKGKRKKDISTDGEVVEMERANKDAIKRCTLDHLYKAKDPTARTVDKSHPEFKDIFGWISRGVGYAL
ncbi:hypothetical protein H0H81_010430, partial [Sphagnurus paluster]